MRGFPFTSPTPAYERFSYLSAPDMFAAVRWACLVLLLACTYTTPNAGLDPIDVAVDQPLDAGPRVGQPIAAYTFDETSGTTAADSVPGDALTLTFSGTSMITWQDGGVRLNARSTATSITRPHLNADIKTSGAASLEAWVMPANATQGESSYALIAASSVSIMLRNIALEQRGNTWAARARTSATNANGEPAIVANVPVSTTEPTHLVVVVDASTRVLYVNGVAFQSSPEGGGTMTTWDPNYKFRIGDEDGADRAWLGTLWLVAMYDRALTPGEVMTNYLARHDCVGC